jgi:uncharacterized protein (DUF2126 family)/transglutaminase-like putative cysteine protease
MSIHIALNHITTYRYDKLVSLGPQIVRLRPAPHARTPILNYSLKIKPEKHFINWQQDPQGNYLARLNFPDKTDLFHIEVDLTADMMVINPFDFFLESYAEEFPFEYEPALVKELKPFLETDQQGPAFESYFKALPRKKRRTIDHLVELIQGMNKDIRYIVRLEPGVQTPDETFRLRSGSCRDSAWALVHLLRRQGLAARFVSGYLIQLKADVKPLEGPAGAAEDFTDLHAWAEVYLPGAGWIGLDPTSGLLTGEGHIPLVAAPEPASASPVSGMVSPSEVTFHHQMKVTRLHEDPRVTKPYTSLQWDQIISLGRKVDAEFKEGDVRLTMGGEPTFVSIDDMESAQWNTAALGEQKRQLSQNLLTRLKQRWAPGALIYTGQGKWYPGEQLPRWVLGCYWRKDGKPVWKDEKWLADETKTYSFDGKDAKNFITALTRHLGVLPGCILDGYEDVFYYLCKEKRLPGNVNPLDSKIKDELERERLTRIFAKDLGEVVGYALPLKSRAEGETTQWLSAPWHFRAGHMFLIPGDSPMGLRMPLDSLPWLEPKDQPELYQRDPLERTGELADPFLQNEVPVNKAGQTAKDKNKQKQEKPPEVVRTALCVEARKGGLYVFLPPVEKIEEYLNLIAGIEKTASELKMPVVIEGYAPPYDPRVESFQITPDPGVIEVNVAPSGSWEQLVEQTGSLYEQAHLARLGTDKFMLDGKHSGTGGGNHMVLGGRTPGDSPFLRNPKLLASMVSYWNNHPSLSYLFSSQFVGPTSQAPRVDEGRRDSVYELEIAIEQVDDQIRKFGQCPPWIVDRLFRHLLVDGTGNTHRAEFCIDKLFSPDTSRGRLGLVELRGFEMPPHHQMNLVQQLLIRSLVCHFWKKPYQEKLVRWDTSLHDRFFLPFFVNKDFQDVLADLNQAGFGLKPEYFAPHLEFRFPKIGEVQYQNINLELRTAIEPWYVLGEEPAGGGTARYVDSSVERLQIRVKGATNGRYCVCCNQRKIPLHATAEEGEFIAGVRYRAWQPPSCLHPTIPVHAPLVFDIFDLWQKRSLGGCVYHVSHPGGRNYDTFPVNAFEAEARRNARFFKIGHTHGTIDHVLSEERNADFPMTLDLRRTAPVHGA